MCVGGWVGRQELTAISHIVLCNVDERAMAYIMLWTPNRFDIFFSIFSIGFPLECFW